MKEKQREKKGALKGLLPFVKPYKRKLVTAVILGVIGSLLSSYIPVYIQKISGVIEKGIETQIDFSKITFYAVSGGILILLGALFEWGQAFLMAFSSNKLVSDIRSAVNDKMDRIPVAYYDRTSTGDILSRATNDAAVITKALTGSIGTLTSSAVLVVGCAGMMLYINWILALCVIGTTLLGMKCNTVLMKKGKKKFQKQRKLLGEINGGINENLTGHMIIKAFNCEEEVLEEFNKINQELEESTWRSEFFSKTLSPIMTMVGNLSYVVVCVVGAVLLMNRMTTVSVIAAFILYVKMFSRPMNNLFQSVGNIQPAMASAERILELLELEENVDEGKQELKAVRGEVTFDHVKFGYVPGQTILKDFSAVVKPGMKVAIVGPTGAGKSTIVNLLMRFYELNGGQIRIDGIPLTEISRKSLHQCLGMVLQETWCFEGSIRENIVYSTQGVSEERLLEVVEEVGLKFMTDALPNGLDTVISEQSSVSAGQKQLITIARAMVKNAPILILDEATSSVDTRTEQYIQKSIDALCEGRTSFVIAHRLSTIRNADLIFVLKDGDIIEMGNHEALLKQGGFYCSLYYSQFDTDKSGE